MPGFEQVHAQIHGVFNAYDKCDDTPKSVKVNNTGCERTIDPYTMEINYNKNRMTIDGYISSMKMRDKFLDKLRVSYPTLEIIDELSIDKGEPKGWIDFFWSVDLKKK